MSDMTIAGELDVFFTFSNIPLFGDKEQPCGFMDGLFGIFTSQKYVVNKMQGLDLQESKESPSTLREGSLIRSRSGL